MGELKAAFEAMGFSDVVTYINSGNVVFTSPNKPNAAVIKNGLQQTFGSDIGLVIYSANQIIRIAESIPESWQNDSEQKSDVVYLFPEVDDARFVMRAGYNSDIETALYVPGAVIWNINRANQQRGSLVKIVGTNLYRKVTIRNVNTARKLAELVR